MGKYESPDLAEIQWGGGHESPDLAQNQISHTTQQHLISPQ